MKTIKNLLSIFVIITTLSFFSCENEPLDSSLLNQEDTNMLPVLTTTTVTNITSITATSGGTITSDGGSAITSRGVVWSTRKKPTIANSKTINGSGVGNFVSSIANLNAGTTYYVRAYATNGNGTAYGNEVKFTTTSLFGIYDLTHILGSSNLTVDQNNDGIFSTNFLNEKPGIHFDADKIILNSDGTFSYYTTITNNSGINGLVYSDTIFTGNWSINGTILTLTNTENFGPEWFEFIISGNTLIDRELNTKAYSYLNGLLTTIDFDYINNIYTKQ